MVRRCAPRGRGCSSQSCSAYVAQLQLHLEAPVVQTPSRGCAVPWCRAAQVRKHAPSASKPRLLTGFGCLSVRPLQPLR